MICRRSRSSAAVIVRAKDQDTANAGGAHFGEGDLLAGGFGHASLKRPSAKQSILAVRAEEPAPGFRPA
jgi:hypothetical protein